MALGNILSLIVLLVVVGSVCAVGFVAYQIANDVKANTKKKMEKKNISFSKEGVKVGVKERSQEEQGDSAQKYGLVQSKFLGPANNTVVCWSISGTTRTFPTTNQNWVGWEMVRTAIPDHQRLRQA